MRRSVEHIHVSTTLLVCSCPSLDIIVLLSVARSLFMKKRRSRHRAGWADSTATATRLSRSSESGV